MKTIEMNWSELSKLGIKNFSDLQKFCASRNIDKLTLKVNR